jgi:hypothetical protein
MSGFASWFSFLNTQQGSDELPAIFPLSMLQKDFIAIDVTNLYAKILIDVVERTEGLSEEHLALLSDNCLASETSHGLISLISLAMYHKADLFLVLDKATKVLRKATAPEEAQIRADYKKQAESSVGLFISFKTYLRTDMLRLYSALEYCTIGALNKSMNLSNAIQLKIFDLRSSVALNDKAEAKAQGKSIATALAGGKDVMLDAKDIVENAKPDLTATQTAMQFLNEKRSFYLGLPCSYITGELNSGLGDTGQADAKAVERGLRGYFFSIIKPVCKALFGSDLKFKSEDFNMLSVALDTLKAFELTSEELITTENKIGVINKLFGLPADTKGGPPAEPPPADPANPPAAAPKPPQKPNPGGKPV